MHDVMTFANLHLLFQRLLQLVQNFARQKMTCQHWNSYTISCHMQTCTQPTCTCTMFLYLCLHPHLPLNIHASAALSTVENSCVPNLKIWQRNSACPHTLHAHSIVLDIPWTWHEVSMQLGQKCKRVQKRGKNTKMVRKRVPAPTHPMHISIVLDVPWTWHEVPVHLRQKRG